MTGKKGWLATLVVMLSCCVPLWLCAAGAVSKDMVLVGHHALGGHGDGGEGMALQVWPDGRRLLYLAHEGYETCLSIIDVTRPSKLVLVTQMPSPGPGVARCNSLGLSGNLLVVANQTGNPPAKGEKPAGLWVLDVSDFARIQKATRLDDLKLSFFDTSGPESRGVHAVWFVDGEFAHLTTGMPDFHPSNVRDDQIWVTLDLRNPRQPREVGRWWLPGTRREDACLPGCLPVRHAPFDDGYRPHQIEVWPDHPDRAYVAYIDGGAMILDISGLADVRAGRVSAYTPRLLGRVQFAPPYTAYTHTFQPMFGRSLAWVSDEDIAEKCRDFPKLVWLLDIRAETNPVIIDTAPFHANDGELCAQDGRFGAHNLHPNLPGPQYAHLANTTVASWFSGGVRIFRAVEGPRGVPAAPAHIEELGYYMPAPPAGNHGPAQINHAIVDDRGLIYANDRVAGGLYILRYTGRVPMD